MSDTDIKTIKSGDFGESFSELMKKAAEKEKEDKTPQEQDPKEKIMAILNARQASQPEPPVAEEASEAEAAAEPEAVAPPEEPVVVKPTEVPVFDWKEEEKPVVESYQPVSEDGVISSTTTINGTVSSKGHIRVEGKVIGDIFAYGDVKVTGKIAGDIEGTDIELGDCIVDGDIQARGDVTIGKDSTLSGDVHGQLITIDGKIKGNIDAAKGAHMSGTSVVKGAISAPSLSVSAGAELQGKVEVSMEDPEQNF